MRKQGGKPKDSLYFLAPESGALKKSLVIHALMKNLLTQ